MSFQARLLARDVDPNDVTSTPLAMVTVPHGEGFGDEPPIIRWQGRLFLFIQVGDEPPIIRWQGRLFLFIQGSDFKFGGGAIPTYREIVPVEIS